MYFQVSMIVLALTFNNDMMELIIYAKYSWENTDHNSHSTMNATKPKTQKTQKIHEIHPSSKTSKSMFPQPLNRTTPKIVVR